MKASVVPKPKAPPPPTPDSPFSDPLLSGEWRPVLPRLQRLLPRRQADVPARTEILLRALATRQADSLRVKTQPLRVS
jgi:hypothetical protein